MVIALVNGLIMGVYGRKFYGYSLSIAGQIHVVTGYFALFFALAGALSSGVRLRVGFLRYLSVFAHFLVGVIFYALSSK